jgi:hypothetical protein
LFIIDHRNLSADLRPFKFLIIDYKNNVSDCKKWCIETLLYNGRKDAADELLAWDIPRFPISGLEIMEAGCPKGKTMSIVTAKMRHLWKESDFKMTKEELMEKLPSVIDTTDVTDTFEDSSWPKKRKRRR